MVRTNESVAVIPGPTPLHAIVHGCLEGPHPKWGMLFCDPFAEEKKCAHRVMVEAARAFCEADIGCMRFDYRGTGDSPGEFVEATPELWIEDIVAAASYLREVMGVTTLGLLGLRLGALWRWPRRRPPMTWTSWRCGSRSSTASSTWLKISAVL